MALSGSHASPAQLLVGEVRLRPSQYGRGPLSAEMSLLRRFVAAARVRPITAFFAIVLLTSWGGGAAARIGLRLADARWSQRSALVFFPILIATVGGAGILMTFVTDGRDGLRRLCVDVSRWRVGRWYALLLLPPTCILSTLAVLRATSDVFAPNLFLAGFFFGVPAGLLEEIGWSGFAFQRMASTHAWWRPAVWIGVAWGLWHLPVVDSLGAASPHDAWWLSFSLAFTLLLAPERVIISWAVTRTRSLLLAQLLHISATGSLVVLSPSRVSPAQETLWYVCYAILLWAIAGTIIVTAEVRAARDVL